MIASPNWTFRQLQKLHKQRPELVDEAVRTGKITSAEGNAILSQMILKGYHSPVDEITALIL